MTRYRDAHVLLRSYMSCMSNIEVPAVSSTTITYIVIQNGDGAAGQHPPGLENVVPRKARLQPSYGGAAEQIFLTKTGLRSCDRGPLSLTFRLTSVRVYRDEQRTAHSYYPGESSFEYTRYPNLVQIKIIILS